MYAKRQVFLKLREWIKKIVTAIISLVLAVIVCEVSLRVIYEDKYGKRPGFFIPDEKLGWRVASNLKHNYYGPDFKISVHTNADGHRLGSLGEVEYDKDLIVLCGDSNVFGWGVSTSETFPSYLD